MSLWNLDKALERAQADHKPLPLPEGTKAEQIRQFIERCEEMGGRCLENALEAAAAGDAEACWFAMATRAENQRFKERLERDLAALVEASERTEVRGPSEETPEAAGMEEGGVA